MQTPTLFLASLALAVSTLMPAHAQSKKELVDKILKLQQAQIETFGSMMLQQTMAPLLQNAGMALRVRVAEDKREATAKALEAEVQAFRKEVEPTLRSSAVKHAPAVIGAKLEASFNEAELKELLQYMESPTLKRYNQLGGEMQQTLAQKVATEHRGLVETKLKALDQKLAQLLGLKPGAASSAKP